MTREDEHAEIAAKNPGPHCEQCVYWFLGCLRGRKKWKDKADTPNIRLEGADGKVYPYSGGGPVPQAAMPLRMVCDGWTADPDPTRMGRAVWPQ
jgi:hypothetical protein